MSPQEGPYFRWIGVARQQRSHQTSKDDHIRTEKITVDWVTAQGMFGSTITGVKIKREREWESGAERNFCAQSETTKEPEGKNFLEDVVVFDSPIYY